MLTSEREALVNRNGDHKMKEINNDNHFDICSL